MDYTELNKIIEEFRKKWEIKGNNIWWEEPFKRCFEAGYYQALDDNDILYGEDAKRFIDNMIKTEKDLVEKSKGTGGKDD